MGITTASMPWTTPFAAAISACLTWAPLTSTPEDDDEAPGEVDTLVDPAETILPRQDDEFRCASCRLLKKTSQLSDRANMLCRDCV